MAKTQTGQQKATARKGTGPVTATAKKASSRSLSRDVVAKPEVGFVGPRVTLRDGKQIVPSVRERTVFVGYLGRSNHPRSPSEVSFGGATVEVVHYPENPRRRKGMVPQYASVIATPSEKAVLPISESPMQIAETIRQFDVEGRPAWKSLLEKVPGAKKFAIECSPTSVDLREGGRFSARARLLIDVPTTLSSGRKSFGSVTVPAFVTGTLKGNGELKIEEFRLGIDHPASTGQSERDAGPLALSERVIVKSGLEALSEREHEILSCLMGGDHNKLIARKLDISEATVKVTIKSILRKINAKNRTQTAMWAAEHSVE